MDARTLATAMDNRVPFSRYEELCPAFNKALIQAGCTTVLRVTMWCSQIGHESGGLEWMEEIADGSAYEGRRDLGNTQPGDGRRFKGRGPIQVTGRHNYSKLSAWAHSKGYVDTPTKFVDDPGLLSRPEFGFLGAVWYWTVARPQLNQLADDQLLVAATYAVNGGQHGIDDRRKFYYRALALGDALLPTQTTEEFPVSAASEVKAQLTGSPNEGEYPGWKARRNGVPDDQQPSFTQTDYAREADRELNSRFDVKDAPTGDQATLVGHVLALRAEVRALTALVKGGK